MATGPAWRAYAQPDLIRGLWRELHRRKTCDDAATGWLAKYLKVSRLRFLTLDGARKAITALKARKARPARPGAACQAAMPRWAARKRGRPLSFAPGPRQAG